MLLDDDGIACLNQRYFQKDEATDVISFAYTHSPGAEDETAEIFINIQRCFDVGGRFDGVDRELALYIAHGCDHITGGRDDAPADRRRMRRRERRWLAAAEEAGLTHHLLAEDD